MKEFRQWVKELVEKVGAEAPTLSPKPEAILPVGVHNRGYESLVEKGIARKGAFRARQYRASRVGAQKPLNDFITAFEQELWAREIPFVVHQVMRSAAEQKALFEKGVSRAKAGQSPHQWGCAVDFIHYKKGWELHPDKSEAYAMWAVIGAIGKEVARRKQIPITWGGDFVTIWDPAHWELTGWKTYQKPLTPF